MKYKFSAYLDIDYSTLKKFVPANEEVTKEELIEKCSGEIDADLLKAIKKIEFMKIGIDKDDELYIL